MFRAGPWVPDSATRFRDDKEVGAFCYYEVQTPIDDGAFP